MKQLYQSVSASENFAKFVWQNNNPSATQEWAEAFEASEKADNAQDKMVEAAMDYFEAKFEEVGEYGDALKASVDEFNDQVKNEISNRVDKLYLH